MSKVLIIRFSSIGDIVLTTPVIRCLKQQRPKTEVHYLSKDAYRPLLDPNPHIDHRHYLKNSLWDVISALRKEKFDHIIDLHHNLRSYLVKAALRMKSSTFPKLNFEKWLLVNFKLNRLPDKHIVDRYMEAAKPLGLQNDGKGLEYFIPAEERVPIKKLPKSHREHGYVAFAIAAKHATKRLPTDKIIAVCRKIKLPVVLLGGSHDFHIGNAVAEALGNKVFNACGLYNINQSASLLEQAQHVVTHDTGLMHIAAALKKNIISLWGNTVPEFGMTPYYGDHNITHHVLEVKDLPCRPCTKIGYTQCPKRHFFCMTMIDEEEVAWLVNQNLA